MKTLIKVDHLHLGYDNQEVINDLSFDINQGDFITVLGQNGAGKSTLIKGLLGLIKPMEGQITYYLNEREIGYMPQETKVDRHFPASVYEIVLSGALNRVGYRPFFNSKEKKLAVECATRECLVLDEPSNNLDYDSKEEFYTVLKELHQKGLTIIMITHDLASHEVIGNKILHLDKNNYRMEEVK